MVESTPLPPYGRVKNLGLDWLTFNPISVGLYGVLYILKMSKNAIYLAKNTVKNKKNII